MSDSVYWSGSKELRGGLNHTSDGISLAAPKFLHNLELAPSVLVMVITQDSAADNCRVTDWLAIRAIVAGRKYSVPTKNRDFRQLSDKCHA